jgi:crossover junction endodeoxyribonuclease RuvC
MIDSGVIRTATREPLERRLAAIALGLRGVIGRHLPAEAAVEEVFFSQNVKTALKLAHVRGVVLVTIAEAGLTVGEYSPLEVKTSVVGYGRAEKHQVQLMVGNLLGLKTPVESEDASDALAVAICHACCAVSRRAAGAGR